MAKTIVIGAGVIGLTAAHELRKRGEDVLIVDKSLPGSGSSFGNAGWITPSLSAPVPEPGLVATSIKWMLKRDSPLYIAPRLDPDFIKFLWMFWRNCREDQYQHGWSALAHFNEKTMESFDQLQANGIKFEMHETGLLFISLDKQELMNSYESMRPLEQIGYTLPPILNGNEVQDLEPALRGGLAGGFHIKEERHVRPDTLTDGLVEWLEEHNVEIKTGVQVTGIRRKGSMVTAIDTADGPIEGDKFLLATGAWAGKMSKAMGFSMPVEAGKGYSVTVDEDEPRFKHSMYYTEGRTAFTPFDGGFRVAGTMELSGVNLNMRPIRVDAIWKQANELVTKPLRSNHKRAWVGMRPLTPDGLPIIGQIPRSENLYTATGHAMLGITLAPVTGIAIADLMTSGNPSINIDAFDPARFGTALS